jgi:hypothetical protein
MDEVLQGFPGPRVSFPLQYLGLPLTLGRIKMVHLQYVQDRARSRVAGWQGRLLNIAGRRELVRSVLSSLLVYLPTVVKAPKNFLKEIDKLRRRFLWVGDQELSRGKCKVAWVRVCMPPSNGGAGIIELETFSRALRLRWLWYYWDDRNRPWKNFELPVDNVDISLFNTATLVEIGNGEKASFWTTRWLHGVALATVYPALFKHSRRKNITVKEARTDNKWTSDVDHDMTVNLISQFVDLAERLNGIELRPYQTDKISWLHTSDGQYTARLAYHLQLVGKNIFIVS